MPMMSKINDNNSHKEDMFLDSSKSKLNEPSFFSKKHKNVKPLIVIKNLKKFFGHGKKRFEVLKDIDLEINEGENLALLGSNGAGKTTLVECIIGTTKQTSGKINYLYDYTNNFQEKIGIQFQDSSYPFGLKVKNIVDFMVSVYDLKISKEELNTLIDQFGLRKLWKRTARSLSGGQKQRLNILLALLHKPKIVFLDELSTGLDISAKEQVTNFIADYCKRNKITIVLISHDVNEIEMLCDRLVILQSGMIKVDIYKNEINKNFKNVNNLLKKYI